MARHESYRWTNLRTSLDGGGGGYKPRRRRRKGAGPTGKQTAYLAALRKRSGVKKGPMPKTRREASAEIERLLTSRRQ